MISEKAEPKVYSVSEFVYFIRDHLKETVGNVLVQGEISQINRPRDLVYIKIKDDTSTVTCFALKHEITQPIEEGMEVKVLGFPQLSVGKGEFQIKVIAIELIGEGALRRAYELLKKKLEKEGLFDVSHKRPLPRFPESIGIITSETAAAYTDVLRILKNRWSGITTKLFPVQVQGIGSVKTIVDAFQYFNTNQVVDVIILTRGGGSLEDLQTFNSEDVARAVFSSKIPVICAVGHEKDESLADFVADVRASTPSNAAERVVPDKREVMRLVYNLSQTTVRLYEDALTENTRSVSALIERMSGRMRERVDKGLMMLGARIARIIDFYQKNIDTAKQKIESGRRLIENLDPQNLLKKGYSLTWSKSKKLITNTKDIAIGDPLTTQLSEGIILSRVKEIK